MQRAGGRCDSGTIRECPNIPLELQAEIVVGADGFPPVIGNAYVGMLYRVV